MSIALTFLAVVVAALVAASVLRRRGPSPPPRTLPPSDDLKGLGLSPVRPRVEAGASPASPDGAAPLAREGVPSRATGGTRSWLDEQQARPADGPRPARPRPAAEPSAWTYDAESPSPEPAVGVRAGSPLWAARGRSEALLAASLAARLGGTVAVLRHDGAAYTVEMLAGPPDAAARIDRLPALPAEGHPLDRVPQDGVLTLLDVRDAAALAYRRPGASVAALVRALAPPPAARVLLVADLPEGADEPDDETARLVEQYAELLAETTHGSGAPPAPEAAPSDEPLFTPDFPDDDAPEDAPEDAASPPDDLGDRDGPAEESAAGPAEYVATPGARRSASPPPRSVILLGEINDARSAGRALAFALVTRADAEGLLADAAPEAVAEAEAEVRAALQQTRGVRRVEPFGDLVLGVFLEATPPEATAWARSLGHVTPGLHIGLVAPAAGTGEAVRAAANEALLRAYREGVLHVLAD